MFVKDSQLGENCHKTESVLKCGKNFTRNIMFFPQHFGEFSLYKQGI
jgi:hypothetical protein